MDLKLVSLAVAVLIAGCVGEESRVVGGSPTTIEQFPYIVALIYMYPGIGITVQRCVGTLVSSWHVLTTGFCFTGANLSQMLVRAGSTNSLSGGTLVTISHVIKHPDYVETPRAGDIAVVFLTTPLAVTNTINILFLPPQNQYIPDWSALKVVSWGFESENGPQLEILKTVELFKVPLADCQQIYGGLSGVAITDPVICANAPAAVGMCMGDSGAPMAIGQAVVGFSSYYQECGNSAYPDVFTRVDRYTNWILQVAVAPGRNGTAVRVADKI